MSNMLLKEKTEYGCAAVPKMYMMMTVRPYADKPKALWKAAAKDPPMMDSTIKQNKCSLRYFWSTQPLEMVGVEIHLRNCLVHNSRRVCSVGILEHEARDDQVYRANMAQQ